MRDGKLKNGLDRVVVFYVKSFKINFFKFYKIINYKIKLTLGNVISEKYFYILGALIYLNKLSIYISFINTLSFILLNNIEYLIKLT